ncbi:MAG: hypothetical protein AAFW69_06830 [Pseudomonadota bacterium]
MCLKFQINVARLATILRSLGAALAVQLALSAPAASQDDGFQIAGFRPHASISFASLHVNATQDFQDFNPGFALGFTRRVGAEWFELGAEGGVFRNSFGGRSTYAIAFGDARVLNRRRVSAHAGIFAGFAEYSEIRNTPAGVPRVGDYIFVAGPQVSLRWRDRYELRSRAVFGLEKTDAVVSFQFTYRF